MHEAMTNTVCAPGHVVPVGARRSGTALPVVIAVRVGRVVVVVVTAEEFGRGEIKS
jgi:hypothetical protein